ncbi:MAG: alpha/beta hydrolase-fold protein [Pseudomonadota bacterium]
MKLDLITVETGPEPTHAVVWLHGLGADGHDFEPVVPHLKREDMPDLRFIFPHAATRPVTINGGMVMRAWYDILGLDLNSRVDEAGIRHSAALVTEILEQQEAVGIPASRTVLAGFSQGGAVALLLGLTYAKPLAGIMALSTYLPLADKLAAERGSASQQVPIFWGHGTADPVVAHQLGAQSAQQLRDWGYAVGWHEYQVAHGVHPDEIADIGRWLAGVCAGPAPGRVGGVGGATADP